jgi:hypothetical protein
VELVLTGLTAGIVDGEPERPRQALGEVELAVLGDQLLDGAGSAPDAGKS